MEGHEISSISPSFSHSTQITHGLSERFVPTPVRNAPIALLSADAFPPRAYEGRVFGMNELRVQT